MERISDILADIPFIVLASIVNIQLISTNKMSPFGAIVFAFVLTGWIGPAYRLRTQFYRFKNQEYVLAARTLGASDARIMWKHIFPNTLGTIITASVLTIPGTIFTESMLSYLNIINLNQGSITSLGTILATGQQYMTYTDFVGFQNSREKTPFAFLLVVGAVFILIAGLFAILMANLPA